MANTPSSIVLPLLITKGMIIYPKNQKLIDAGRSFSINAIKVSREKSDSLILIVSQKDMDVENPNEEEIFSVGVLARIVSVSEREKRLRARVEVLSRVNLSNVTLDDEDNCFTAKGTFIPDIVLDENTSSEYIAVINNELEKYPVVLSKLPKNIITMCADRNAAVDVCYALAGFFDAPIKIKQDILETDDISVIAQNVLAFISGENTKDQIDRNISDTVRESTEKFYYFQT